VAQEQREAYLSPHFTHDVFVSYSHGDPRSKDKPQKVWTLKLVRDLEDEVRRNPDYGKVVIWRDEDLDPTLRLSEAIETNVKSSAILFIVMSKHYLRSSWCRDERDWFNKQIEGRRDETGRVFIIRMEDTDESQWPPCLKDKRGFAQIGFAFYDEQTDVPYCWRGTDVNSRSYTLNLSQLRAILVRHLDNLRDERKRKAHAKTQAPPRRMGNGARRIYLHPRAEDTPIRQKIDDLLREDGFEPVGDITSLGNDLGDWNCESKTRIANAKRCDALVLIRDERDENFFWTVKDIGVDERVKIEEERGFSLPCAVLDQSGKELSTDISEWGIERFDLRNDRWRGDFRQWLDKAEPKPVAPPP
jgi:hypothetical protein